MSELKPRIYDEASSLDYILASDYYIPAITLFNHLALKREIIYV